MNSPIGILDIEISHSQLVRLSFSDKNRSCSNNSGLLMCEIMRQLKNYFEDPEFSFEMPLNLNGTTFQKKVWHRLQKIPPGTVLTYGDLAAKLHTSPRAIGNACRNNPIPIIIPCHRIIAANNIGGFAGNRQGRLVQIKNWLLKHETKLARL